MEGLDVVYNENDLGIQSQENIIPLDRIHNHHEQPHLRSYKLLGIDLDENLTFDLNTKKVISKLARSIHCINRVKNILPHKALIALYHPLVHSHLTYCSTITSITSNTNIQKIFKMQKRHLG